jgi:RHS repeat-associated protein
MKPLTMIKTLICFGTLVLVLALSSSICRAQSDGYVNNSNLRGVVPFGSYQFGDIDNINLGTGTLNLNIPIAKRKGRGLDVSLGFTYSSKIWAFSCVKDVQGITHCSWFLTDGPKDINFANAPGGLLGWDAEEYDCTDRLGNEYVQTNTSNYIYAAAGGAEYRFPNSSDTSSPPGHSCGAGRTISVGVSDMEAMELDTPTPSTFTIHFKDGSTKGSQGSSMVDTNGNQVNSTGDTLKRLVTFTSPGTWTFKDSNGTAQSYVSSSQNSITLAPSFPTTTCGSSGISQYGGPWFQNRTLSLPSGLQFRFTYDPNFGEITRVDFPTGGYVRYDYVTLPQFDRAPPGVTACLYIDSRRLAHRYLSPDDIAAHEQTWSYTYAAGYQTTVTDPLGFVTVHTFTSDGIHETQTQFYDQSNHLLRTVGNTWASDGIPVQTNQKGNAIIESANWRITTKTITLADTTQVAQTQTTFDSYTVTYNYATPTTYTLSRVNPLETREYDYGTGAAGNLVRRTTFTYLHDSNTNYLNKHILDRPASKTVYDNTSNTCQGQSRACSQTNFGYDTTSIASTSGVVQHDYTNFPSTMIYRGNPTTVSNWRNTDGAWLTTTNYYDDLGNLKQTQDPLLHNTFFDYTDFFSTTGNICIPSGGTAQAFVTKVTNHLAQFARASYYSCSSWTASTIDLNSQTTAFTYDKMDRQLQTTNPDGGQFTNCYSDTGGATCSQVPAPISILTTKKLNSTTNLTTIQFLDGLARLKSTKLSSDPQGAVFTRTDYDALGHNATIWNPTRCDLTVDPPPTSCPGETTFGTTQFQYDAVNRVTKVIPPDGTTSANNVTTSYSGNCATVTDQAGKNRKSCSDPLGRLKNVWENPTNLNYETDYQYDALNNLTSVVQVGSRQRTFVYDSLSRLTSATNPESGTTTYTYDNDGNVLTKKDARNITITYYPDALNRLGAKAYSDGTETLYYSYDVPPGYMPDCTNVVGRLANTSNSSGGSTDGKATAATFSYDAMGRVVRYWQQTPSASPGGYFVYQSYDLAGDLISATNAAGVTISYGYDAAARPTTVTSNWFDAQHPATLYTVAPSIGYFAAGAVRKATLANGLTETAMYNARLQPCRMETNSTGAYFSQCTDAVPSGNVLDFSYGFNFGSSDNGNVGSWSAVGNQTFTRSYGYDSLNRISTMSDTAASQACKGLSWTIDAWGNRTDQNVTSGTCGTFHATVGANNRLGSPYQYDAAGNMTYDGTHSYSYDAENHLTQVDGGATASYIYDPNGTRVRKNSGGSWTEYFYDMSGNVTAERNPAGWPVEYVYVGGQLIAQYRDSTTYSIFKDHLGSTRLITKLDKSVYDSLDFLPYGEQVAGDTGATHKFTGKERDSESGLDNFGARYNASSIGRWMSPDAINLTDARVQNPANTINKYIYGGNNPLKYIDPDGRDITFFYGTAGATGPGGHFFAVAWDNTTGDYAVLNFGPKNDGAGQRAAELFGIPVEGSNDYASHIQTLDDLRDNFSSFTVQTNPEDAQRAIQEINQFNGQNHDYATFSTNCTTACRDVANKVLKLNSSAVQPAKLWQDVFNAYGLRKGQLPYFRMPAPSKPGTDFGRPRFGINTFDFAWLLLHPQKACITTLVPDGKGGSKSETTCD